ncbi:electron transfer flavoprotein subunit beta/FixA family protein [Candidatus Neomarinimicrobiota bacterium]
MKICVLIKQVPDQTSVLKINADQTWINEDNLVFTTNESDNYALEEGLLLKEQHGGEVVVCTVGPERSTQVLKDALSKGADRAVFLNDPTFADVDIHGLATVISKSLAGENFDLVLTGLQADDTGEAELGLMLAEALGLPHITMVVHTDLSGNTIKVRQELESGWFQEAETELPVLLTIQSGINKPRYASLRGIMGMKSKEIKQLGAADLGISAADLPRHQNIHKVYIPVKTKETTFIEGSAEEIAASLVQKLADEAKVI